MDCAEELVVIERFGKERGRSEFHRGLFRAGISPPRHDDDTCPRRQLRKLGLQFQSRHFLHPDVEDDERDRMRLDVCEKTLRVIERADPNPSKQPNGDRCGRHRRHRRGK